MALGVKASGQKILTSIDNLDFFDLKTYMADFGADLLFGQGIVITSESEEIKKFLTNFTKKNKFDDFMLAVAFNVNYYGRVVMTIDKSVNGEFAVSYATPELMQDVSMIEITPFKAVLLKQKVVGQRVFYQREIWTSSDVKRSITVKDQLGTGEYDADRHGEIPPELDIPAYEKHNLGFVPIINILNKPNRNIMVGTNPDGYKSLADDYTVQNMPIHINNGLRQMFKEEILAKSRLAGNVPISDIKKKGGLDNVITADAFIGIDPSGQGNNPVAVMTSTYDGMKWLDPQKGKINLYARGCGYSDVFPTESAQTEAETLYSKDNNQRTAKSKRRRYTELLNDLFSKLLIYKGLMSSLDDELPFTVEIKENVVYNKLQLAEFLITNIEGRLMTHAEAIAEQRDLDSIEEAEAIRDIINEEADERDQKEADLMNDSPGEGLGKAGSGGDPDTTKED